MGEMCLLRIIHRYITSDLFDKITFSLNPHNVRKGLTFRLPKPGSNIRFKCPSFRLQHEHNQRFNQVNIVRLMPVDTFRSLVEAELY